MTLRGQIEGLLADRPMTGAEIRHYIGGTSTAVHRYLCELRRRGVIVGERDWSGVVVYALPGSALPPRAIALNWRARSRA